MKSDHKSARLGKRRHMNTLPKLRLDLKSPSPDLEIIDLDAENDNRGDNLQLQLNGDDEEKVDNIAKDRNNNSNIEHLKGLDR